MCALPISSRRVLFAAPAYLAAAGRPSAIDDLARHRLLAADGQMPWRLTGAGATAIDTPSAIATDSSEVVRELAIAGAGIALRSIWDRSEEHTSELQSLMRISYAVFCLKKKRKTKHHI